MAEQRIRKFEVAGLVVDETSGALAEAVAANGSGDISGQPLQVVTLAVGEIESRPPGLLFAISGHLSVADRAYRLDGRPDWDELRRRGLLAEEKHSAAAGPGFDEQENRRVLNAKAVLLLKQISDPRAGHGLPTASQCEDLGSVRSQA